ncbi:HD domain-containing protein [Candidatus Woesearchaeota archaeon]|nr:HD domain-containing protein [Candidatus Woesearchaeota archaeon]
MARKNRLSLVNSYVKDLLSKNLPKNLYYHNIEHTFNKKNGMVAMVSKLTDIEKIPSYQKELLIVAAYFHDTGYTESSENNELIAARIASGILPALGFTKKEISIIKSLILATASNHKPENIMEEIIKDADLDNLGRDDFFERCEDLRKELNIKNKLKWYKETLKFLKKHRYFTSSAIKLRNTEKSKNILKLIELIKKYS